MLRFLRLFRLALWRGFQHDIFTSARSAAYYSTLTLFPLLMVVAAVLDASKETVAFLKQIAGGVNGILPPGSPDVARLYFENQRSPQTITTASIIMLIAASGMVVSWMDGFLHAYGMEHCWNPFKERAIALLLVVLAFIPMTFATVSVIFGNQIEQWMINNSVTELGPAIILFWWALRWLTSAITSVAVLALIYHLGIPRWQPWYRVLPGAMLTTVMWLGATEIFGWYITNFGDYNVIYGPLGAAIALLVWMYIISFIVLLGAEFNALVYPRSSEPCHGKIAEPEEPAASPEPSVAKEK
jgi:membrane protein